MATQKLSHTIAKIHLKALRTNTLHILFALSFTLLCNIFGYTQEFGKKDIRVKPVQEETTKPKPQKKDTAAVPPTNTKLQDTVKIDSTAKAGNALTQNLKHNADGYTSIRREENKTYLYDKAVLKYGDYEIESGIIIIDYSKNTVYAGRIKDSLGNFSQAPVFKQGGEVVESDSIQFNFKTKKALIWNSKTEQQGGTIYPEISKKVNDSVIYIKNAKFTTSEDPDNPEYYILVRKGKIVPGKKVVTGLANLFIADVPTPVGIPFGWFPLTKDKASGVIFPTFGEQNERGYFIQNGGYYFAINDYLDLAVTGDYYTNGSYGLRAETSYANRYNYRGRVSFRFENLIEGERGFPDFQLSEIFNLNWNHSKDPKSNPNSSFSASVNIGSSSFFQESLNQLSSSSFLNNTLSSSISYSRRFQTIPEVNLTLAATQNQNTQTNVIDLTLPTLQASVDRVFPFAPKTGAKRGIINNINFQYNVRAENRITTTDDALFSSSTFENALIGARHTIPINTNFKIFKFFSVSANANYEETWTLNTINRRFDVDAQEIVTENLNGFDAYRTYNLNASIGTTVYGTYTFGENSKIQKIRNVIRPTLSYNINPAFDQFFERVEGLDSQGRRPEELEFSRFEGSLFGAPSNQFSSSLALNVGSNLEAKIKSKDSTDLEPKKITLLSNFNLATSYNFAADSLNLSPIAISGGTQLFNDRLSLNFGATLDPYALDNNNNRVNTFNVNNGGGLVRLTNANVTAGFNFSSTSFNRGRQQSEASRQETTRNGGRDDNLFGISESFGNSQFDTTQSNQNEQTIEGGEAESEFYNFNVPWSINLSYSLNFSNVRRENQISSHSVNFNGDIQLSPLWSIGASSGYDLLNRGATFTQLRFERDLKSWRINFTWVPFSDRSSWNFFIGVKSDLLKDLKHEKRRERDRQL